jgi:hypothetical protein
MPHPDLLKALAEARQDDLIHERRPRRPAVLRFRWRRLRFDRARCRLGSLFISAGGRITGHKRDALDLAHEWHRKLDAKRNPV